MSKLFILTLLCILGIANSATETDGHRRRIFGETINLTSVTRNASDRHMNGTTKSMGRTTAAPTPMNKTSADVAVAVIIVIVISVILGMAIYFIRKFDQLNKMVPTYRYSSLKTEVNGMNGFDEKNEAQCLVSASTEEEDDFDDDEVSSPPTLIVQSQMTLSNAKMEHPIQNKVTSMEIKQILATDSDDELLQ